MYICIGNLAAKDICFPPVLFNYRFWNSFTTFDNKSQKVNMESKYKLNNKITVIKKNNLSIL